jgi:hypothetical protein
MPEKPKGFIESILGYDGDTITGMAIYLGDFAAGLQGEKEGPSSIVFERQMKMQQREIDRASKFAASMPKAAEIIEQVPEGQRAAAIRNYADIWGMSPKAVASFILEPKAARDAANSATFQQKMNIMQQAMLAAMADDKTKQTPETLKELEAKIGGPKSFAEFERFQSLLPEGTPFKLNGDELELISRRPDLLEAYNIQAPPSEDFIKARDERLGELAGAKGFVKDARVVEGRGGAQEIIFTDNQGQEVRRFKLSHKDLSQSSSQIMRDLLFAKHKNFNGIVDPALKEMAISGKIDESEIDQMLAVIGSSASPLSAMVPGLAEKIKEDLAKNLPKQERKVILPEKMDSFVGFVFEKAQDQTYSPNQAINVLKELFCEDKKRAPGEKCKKLLGTPEQRGRAVKELKRRMKVHGIELEETPEKKTETPKKKVTPPVFGR